MSIITLSCLVRLELVNTKINVNITEELCGEELLPLSKISKHFPSQPADEHIHVIVQRPVETKEVHCTATYGRKSANFQWTVTRETVTLEGFKKKLREYFTFPDGTENEHIASSSSQSATVENATERKIIQFSADEDLLSIIWTVDPKVDLEIVVDTCKADSYDQLPFIEIGSSATPEEIRNSVIEDFLRMHKASPPITSANEATRCEFISAIIYGVASIFDGTLKVYPQHEVSGSNGKGPIDWVIKMGDTIISVTEAKREDINQGVAQSTVQAHASLQCNRKKRTYDDADLYEGAMYCIVST
ncbi:14295_t:CDS:2, partial [Acaulospora colombiana]